MGLSIKRYEVKELRLIDLTIAPKVLYCTREQYLFGLFKMVQIQKT